MITVVEHFCPQNHPCPTLRVCPTGALTQQGYAAPKVDEELCIDCGRCLLTCPAFRESEHQPAASG